ncbi:MAG: class I SAM-dependent methyltransferase [Sodalis sp. (in: enterobacteria)]|uniref:class I SAM-dependent methyltransferase n=1 Tax=Sodalis sp. (in: enterobacteria) TaxID=1898979 RepID=UPI003F3E6527
MRKRDEPKLGALSPWILSPAPWRIGAATAAGAVKAVAKAVGIKGQGLPDVVDATAGLGRDAFVLACLGCRVQMFERHPVMAALLKNGLRRV